jgi:hypothetical protein
MNLKIITLSEIVTQKNHIAGGSGSGGRFLTKESYRLIPFMENSKNDK